MKSVWVSLRTNRKNVTFIQVDSELPQFRPVDQSINRLLVIRRIIGSTKEPSSDPPSTLSTIDYAYFNTPLGRYGSIDCFDIIFEQPPVYRELQHRSRDASYTEWMHARPYCSADTFHRAFVIGLCVNLLDSNRHERSLRGVGSGIYIYIYIYGSNRTCSFIHDEPSS